MDVERLLAVGLDLHVALSVRLAGLSYTSNIGNKLPIGHRLASNTVPYQAPTGMLRLIYGLFDRYAVCRGRLRNRRRIARDRRAIGDGEKDSRLIDLVPEKWTP
jgi:hypothetical protein